MSLISCPECDKQVSDRAVSCPNCGVGIALPHYHEQSQQPYQPPYQPPVYNYTTQSMLPPSEIKKPIYYRVWFWLLVALGLLIFIPLFIAFFIGVIRGALSVAI